LLQCLGDELECPLKCSDSLKFGNSTYLAKHLEDACPEMQLQCSICKEKESRVNLASHDWCPIGLKKRNVDLTAKDKLNDHMTQTLTSKND